MSLFFFAHSGSDVSVQHPVVTWPSFTLALAKIQTTGGWKSTVWNQGNVGTWCILLYGLCIYAVVFVVGWSNIAELLRSGTQETLQWVMRWFSVFADGWMASDSRSSISCQATAAARREDIFFALWTLLGVYKFHVFVGVTETLQSGWEQQIAGIWWKMAAELLCCFFLCAHICPVFESASVKLLLIIVSV